MVRYYLRMVLLITFLLIQGMFSSYSVADDGVPITIDASSKVSIVIRAEAGTPLTFAAKELQRYLQQIAKITCSITQDVETEGVVFLLTSQSSPLAIAEQQVVHSSDPTVNPDDYKIKTDGQRVIISGATERAVLFGVYDFLERIGCQWFAPLEEFVPQTENLNIPAMDISEHPVMKMRILELIAGSDPAVIDWMAKVRLNGTWPEKYTPEMDMTSSKSNMEMTAVPDMITRGMTIYWGGHILPTIFSPEKYKDHPEYFAQIKGKRLDPEVDPQSRWQLCTSNPEVMRILVENTVTFLRNHEWLSVLVIWGNDTTEWCDCDECRKLEPDPEKKSPFNGGPDRSATYSRMIKIIDEGVRKELPARRIAFNHYYNLEDIPSDLDVLPARSVISAVDAYRQCDRHPFSDPNCPKGKRIEPISKMWNPHYDDVLSWSYYWSWNFMKGLPLSMVHKIPDDFRFLRSLGVTGVVDNVSLVPATMGKYDLRPIFFDEQWRYNSLNFHIYAKAAWNPDLNVDETVAKFIKGYYGPAAEPMNAFWDLMEQSTTKFGLDPAFMPSDPEGLVGASKIDDPTKLTEAQKLKDTNALHGWMMNIRYLIPNQRVYDELMKHLSDARLLAATAYEQPLKPEYLPYMERVQLLERCLSFWPTTPAAKKLGHL